MQKQPAHPRQWPQGLLRAFAPMRGRGFLIDGLLQASIAQPANLAASSAPKPAKTRDDPPVNLFVKSLRELLAADNESARRRLEQRVLALAVPLKDAGVFDVVNIANPPLAAMVADHLSEHESIRGSIEV